MSEVEFPDGTIVEFPDNVTPGLISTVIRRYSVPGQPLHMSVRENYGTMPSQDEYGRFNVGGSLGGKAGALDTAYDFMPWRSWDRFKEAAKVEVQPDLMGGATANIADKYGAALEATDLLGLGVDVGDAARVGRRFLKPAAAQVENWIGQGADNLMQEGLFKTRLNKQIGTIGSTGAKTADLDALKVAEEMKASGASADDIYSQTRWWLDHPDGRPRFEIDDSGASLVDWPELASHETAPLGSAQMNIAHDELYKNYPDMKKIDIAAQGAPGGMFSPANSDYATDGIRTHPDSVWHELQHGVQKREGLSRGGSPGGPYQGGELQSLIQRKFEQIKKIPGNAGESDEALYNHARMLVNSDEGRYQSYKALAGEAEARLVQNRANLTPAERLEFPFYDDSQKAVNNIGGYFGYDVPLEDQIVRMEGGTANAIGYHGSPHKFDRFDHARMGSGEGAQAYGWGTYLAENPDTGGFYKNALSSGDVKRPDGSIVETDIIGGQASNLLSQYGNDYEKAKQNITGVYKDEIAEWIDVFKQQDAKAELGNLYTVDLPDSKIAQMLDWDAPLSEQPESVRKAIESLGDRYHRMVGEDAGPWPSNYTGGDIYKALGGSEYTSRELNQLGIPGIKYFDGNSRGAGKGTSNFVVFDENDMSILTRNGEPVAQSADLPMGKGVIKPKQLGDGIPENAGVKKWRDKITETGQVKPIEVDKTGFIVDGEHRYKALMDLGVEDIPVYVGEQQGASGRLTRPYSGISVDVKIPTQKY